MGTKTRSYLGVEGRHMKPTPSHRPAIWECMLGTVYALNDKGKVRYFDFDYDAAKEFAGIDEKRDLRIWKNKRWVRWGNGGSCEQPRMNQLVLWIKEAA